MDRGTRRIRISDGRLGDEPARPVLYVVDDDEATRGLLRDVADEAGWDAVGFAHLGHLRAAIRARPPALVILDDDLPDGRGGDVARELRDDPHLAGAPILVCTAAHPMRRAEIGAWAPVVAKPFALDDIERFFHGARNARRGGDAERREAG